MSKHHYKAISKSAWARLRRQVLARDGWRCQQCGKAGRLECDHVTPLHRGGAETDPDNLQALCRSCHLEKNRREHEQRNPTNPQVAAWADFVKSAFEKKA